MTDTPTAGTNILMEVLDRTRRIETRLTKFMEASGFDTKVRRPLWNGEAIIVPSPATSLRDCLSVIPADHSRTLSIPVYHKDELLLVIGKP